MMENILTINEPSHPRSHRETSSRTQQWITKKLKATNQTYVINKTLNVQTILNKG